MKLPNRDEEKLRNNHDVTINYLDNETKVNTFKGKHYFLKTYGCQMNVHDSEEIKAHLENLGLTSTLELENSDVIVLNTCAIRENAHEKVFGYG
jgi:tRNA-2-methylthio-N6-dimethylallyladenosine synthase